MGQSEELVEIFQRERPRLRRIAHRILGAWDEAEEAVQETWLKAGKIPAEEIRNASAWLTTITTRLCLDRLRYRRRHAPTQALELDDPANEREAADITGDDGPEHAALSVDSIGVALLVVLERLRPLERVAFVLRDVFDLPFDEIASLIDRSPEAARQLASRARRRVRGTVEVNGKTISRHRELAETFLQAVGSGDMATLLKLLDPDVVLTADEQAARMGAGNDLRGSPQVARFLSSGRAGAAHVTIINGDVGIIVAPRDRLLLAVMPRFENGRITHLHVIGAADDLARLDIGLLAEATEPPDAGG